MAPTFGGEQALRAAMVGAVARGVPGRKRHADRRSANLVVAASRSAPARTFRFVEFLKVAFPLMLLSISFLTLTFSFATCNPLTEDTMA
jgi:hypothetical protein